MFKRKNLILGLVIGVYLFFCSQGRADQELILYWDFNQGSGNLIVDKSENKNAGTIGGQYDWVKGVEDWGIIFTKDGSSYIDIRELKSKVLEQLKDNCSFEVWCLPIIDEKEKMAPMGNILRGASWKGSWPFFICGAGGKDHGIGESFFLWVNAPNYRYYAPKVEAYNWFYLVTTYDYSNKEAKIYLNGELTAEGKIAPVEGLEKVELKNRWRIGGGFLGIIDELKIWAKVLTPEEIKENFRIKKSPLTKEQLKVRYEKYSLSKRINLDNFEDVLISKFKILSIPRLREGKVCYDFLLNPGEMGPALVKFPLPHFNFKVDKVEIGAEGKDLPCDYFPESREIHLAYDFSEKEVKFEIKLTPQGRLEKLLPLEPGCGGYPEKILEEDPTFLYLAACGIAPTGFDLPGGRNFTGDFQVKIDPVCPSWHHSKVKILAKVKKRPVLTYTIYSGFDGKKPHFSIREKMGKTSQGYRAWIKNICPGDRIEVVIYSGEDKSFGQIYVIRDPWGPRARHLLGTNETIGREGVENLDWNSDLSIGEKLAGVRHQVGGTTLDPNFSKLLRWMADKGSVAQESSSPGYNWVTWKSNEKVVSPERRPGLKFDWDWGKQIAKSGQAEYAITLTHRGNWSINSPGHAPFAAGALWHPVEAARWQKYFKNYLDLFADYPSLDSMIGLDLNEMAVFSNPHDGYHGFSPWELAQFEEMTGVKIPSHLMADLKAGNIEAAKAIWQYLSKCPRCERVQSFWMWQHWGTGGHCMWCGQTIPAWEKFCWYITHQYTLNWLGGICDMIRDVRPDIIFQPIFTWWSNWRFGTAGFSGRLLLEEGYNIWGMRHESIKSLTRARFMGPILSPLVPLYRTGDFLAQPEFMKKMWLLNLSYNSKHVDLYGGDWSRIRARWEEGIKYEEEAFNGHYTYSNWDWEEMIKTWNRYSKRFYRTSYQHLKGRMEPEVKLLILGEGEFKDYSAGFMSVSPPWAESAYLRVLPLIHPLQSVAMPHPRDLVEPDRDCKPNPISFKELKKYEVVLLASHVWRDEFTPIIEEYVREGGGLILIGPATTLSRKELDKYLDERACEAIPLPMGGPEDPSPTKEWEEKHKDGTWEPVTNTFYRKLRDYYIQTKREDFALQEIIGCHFQPADTSDNQSHIPYIANKSSLTVSEEHPVTKGFSVGGTLKNSYLPLLENKTLRENIPDINERLAIPIFGKIKVDRGGVLIRTTNNEPVVVVNEYGKGRIVTIAADICFGIGPIRSTYDRLASPFLGEKPFCPHWVDWLPNDWQQILQNSLLWAAQKDEKIPLWIFKANDPLAIGAEPRGKIRKEEAKNHYYGQGVQLMVCKQPGAMYQFWFFNFGDKDEEINFDLFPQHLGIKDYFAIIEEVQGKWWKSPQESYLWEAKPTNLKFTVGANDFLVLKIGVPLEARGLVEWLPKYAKEGAWNCEEQGDLQLWMDSSKSIGAYLCSERRPVWVRFYKIPEIKKYKVKVDKKEIGFEEQGNSLIFRIDKGKHKISIQPIPSI